MFDELIDHMKGDGRAFSTLAVADVIHVMSQGRLVATVSADEADYERILHAALP